MRLCEGLAVGHKLVMRNTGERVRKLRINVSHRRRVLDVRLGILLLDGGLLAAVDGRSCRHRVQIKDANEAARPKRAPSLYSLHTNSPALKKRNGLAEVPEKWSPTARIGS